MGQLKIWWVPQIPMEAFEVGVKDLEQASLLLSVLSDYDSFQFENKVKPDYCNAGGLVEQDPNGEWYDWENEDGCGFDEVRRDAERMAKAIADREQVPS